MGLAWPRKARLGGRSRGWVRQGLMSAYPKWVGSSQVRRTKSERIFHCFLPNAQGGRRRVAAAFRFSVCRVKFGRPVGFRADLPSIALAD